MCGTNNKCVSIDEQMASWSILENSNAGINEQNIFFNPAWMTDWGGK